MKWKLKSSTAKKSNNACVIKVTRTNLTGDFMPLSKLSHNEHNCEIKSVGIYIVVNNIDKSKSSKNGCYFVYKSDNEDFLRYINISDEKIRKIPAEFLQSDNYINETANEIRNNYKNF